MFFEHYVTVVGPYSKIQDPKTNMEDSKTMIWRKGGSWVEEEGDDEEEGWWINRQLIFTT